MNIVPQETSLLLVGAWNPAILTPHWVMTHGLRNQDANSQMVQALFVAGLNGVFESPRFGMPGFHYSARPDALVMLPDETGEESFSLVENVTKRILENLSHTPIGGLGHNFEFRDDAPKDEWLAVFANSQIDLVDASGGLDVTRTTLATSFSKGRILVNVQRYTESGTLVVKFNFHHPVQSAASALEALSGNGYDRLWANYQTALDIVNQLYPKEMEAQ